MVRQLLASIIALCGFSLLNSGSGPAIAGDVVLEGRLQAVSTKNPPSITIDGVELIVVPKTEIQIDGKPARFKELKINQQATVEYDDDLTVVRSIAVGDEEGKNPLGKKGLKLDTSLLRKKLAAIKRFDPKTRTIALEYGFQKPAELKDFSLGENAPVAVDGVLTIPANTELTHAVPFTSVHAQAVYSIENMTDRRALVSFSTGVKLEYHKPGRVSRCFLLEGNRKISEALIKEEAWRKSPTLVSIEYAPQRGTVDVKVGDDPLGGPVQFAEIGTMTFHGGSGGIRIKSLIIEGVPTDAWIQALLAGEK